MSALLLVIGLLVGAGVVFGWQQSARARERSTAIREREALTERAVTAEAELRAEGRMLDGFKAVAGETLVDHLERVTAAENESRDNAVTHLVTPVRDGLATLQKRLEEVEQQRATSDGTVQALLGDVKTATAGLLSETTVLSRGMRDSRARGSWGEIQLQRVVELAGMTNWCDFAAQHTIDSGSGRQRPDVTVMLPGSRKVYIDAKAPLDAFLDAAACVDAEQAELRYADHAAALAGHVSDLAKRGYGEGDRDAFDLVVLFVPGDAFLSAALDKRPGLVEDAFAKNVVIASPSTLLALLKTIENGWRQQKLADNAEAIAKLGAELHDRIAVFAAHLADVGSSLGKAVDAHNAAVGSLERRVLPSARKMAEHGAPTTKAIPDIEPVDAAARPLAITATADDTDDTGDGEAPGGLRAAS